MQGTHCFIPSRKVAVLLICAAVCTSPLFRPHNPLLQEPQRQKKGKWCLDFSWKFWGHVLHIWPRLAKYVCVFKYVQTFMKDFKGFPVSKINSWPLCCCNFTWRIQISHIWKHLRPPLLHVLLQRQQLLYHFSCSPFPKGLQQNLQWRMHHARTLGHTQRQLYLEISWYHVHIIVYGV